jgi:type I restriction enzyme R subunit
MSRQSEQIVEEQLLAQLQKMGYAYIVINSEKD